MSIVEIICRMNEIVTEIRKCESLYFGCDDSEPIYKYILNTLYILKNPSLLFQLAAENLDEHSNVENLKIKLIQLYGVWRNEFIKVLTDYHEVIEQMV